MATPRRDAQGRFIKGSGGSTVVVRDRSAEVAAQIVNGVAAGLYLFAERVMAKSKAEYVPVLYGVLRASGTVFQPVVRGNVIEVRLGFGGAAKAYAVRIHEDLSLRHPRGGQAKYLERPVLEMAPGMSAAVAATARARVR